MRVPVSIGLAILFVACSAKAQQNDSTVFVDLRQGTGLSLTTEPGLEFIVIELLGQLWRMPRDGGAAVPLTQADGEVRHPRINNAGTHVLYQRLIDGGWDIWMLNLQTEVHTAITSAPGNEREPDFLPDDTGYLFAADRSGGYDLWSTAEPNGLWQPISTERGDARFPDVADNGAIVYVVSAAGGDSLRARTGGLTRTIYESTAPLAAPAWRPGGGVIMFSERQAGAGARLMMAILSPAVLVRAVSAAEDIFASPAGWLDAANFVYAADGQIWRRALAGSRRTPVHLFATTLVSRTDIPRVTLEPPVSAAQIAATTDSTDAVYAIAGDIWLQRDNAFRQLTEDEYWNEDPLIDPRGEFVVYARSSAGERRLVKMPIAEPQHATILTPSGSRAFAAALDTTGTRLAWLSSDAAFSRFAPAILNTLWFDDATQRRSEMALNAVGVPRWLDDNRLATIRIDVRADDGAMTTLDFDAGLREVARADAQMPARNPAAAAPGPAPLAELPAVRPADSDPPDADQKYVIQAGRLFDAIGTGYRRHVDIHIEAGRIVTVTGRDRLPLPPRVIDATDLTVLPGFIDLHTHDHSLLGELAGRAWLAYGVTAIRSLGPHTAAQRSISYAWHSGLLPGPRYIEAHYASAAALIDDPFVTLPGELPIVRLEDSLLPALPRIGPASRVRRYSPGFEHYQDVFAMLAASGATEVSSLGILATNPIGEIHSASPGSRRVFEQLFSRTDRARWQAQDPLADGLAARQRTLARLLRAGGRLAIGSETPQMPPGLGMHIEFRLLAGAGVPNDQILRAATSGAALTLGLEAEIGSVEAGRLADLVVVEGDPLSDISATLAVHAVVRGGKWIERTVLTSR